MDIAAYFAIIINIMMVVAFLVLFLAFLYMVYSREEKTT
jgi:cbb3-type cytochrome oxidase subunit 3